MSVEHATSQRGRKTSQAHVPAVPQQGSISVATDEAGTASQLPDSQPRMCEVATGMLQCRTDHADRFVYSKQFMPLRVEVEGAPLVTFYQARAVQAYVARHREALAPALEKREMRELLAKAGIKVAEEIAHASPGMLRAIAHAGDEPDGASGNGATAAAASIERLAAEHEQLRGERIERGLTEVEELMRIARSAESVPVSAQLTALIEDRLSEIMSASGELRPTIGANTQVLRGQVYGRHPGPHGTTVGATDPADVLINLLKSNVGYLFFDRTRIRPSGFSIGEHLYALSLAPGEEVVLEQKTFSKRQLTFEEQTEEEQQQDLELSSTLSTELQEGAELQRSRTSSSGFSAGGSVGANIDGADLTGNLGYSTNLTEADTETRTRSVKESTSSTQRVAAKYRAAHKVSFRVSTEEGFEATSKRVLRNPNRFTPINLHYFKVMQVLELMQQRYGVRLAWAPHIKDPGFDLVDRIRTGREAILAKAEAIALPPKPTPPVKADKPPQFVRSAMVEANQWGAMCDMRYDYTLEIPVPPGYIWDESSGQLTRDSLETTITNVARSKSIYVIGEPWPVGDKLQVKVHVGVDWTSPIGGCGSIYLRVGARFIPDPAAQDPAYQQAYAQYLADLAAWQSAADAKLAAARAQARAAADAWEQEMLRSINPLGELMNRVIRHEFAPASRDESWEIELWQHIFDWNAASFVLYPAWWSDLPMRDPLKPATDFFNASWAKLYVPVKVGFERMALRWIFGQQAQTPLSADVEAAFDGIETELRTYRQSHFGDERESGLENGGGECSTWAEKVLCLARWTELLPTDGTHLEVVQSSTSAADQYSRAELDALRNAQQAALDSVLQDIELKKKGVASMKKEVGAEVQIVVNDGTGG